MSTLAPAWRSYRTRRRLLVAALVGIVPALTGVGMALRELTGSDTPRHLLAAGWITASVAAVIWFGAFRCPYCGDFFHWTLWVADPLSDECLHCGFARWRDPDAAKALARR